MAKNSNSSLQTPLTSIFSFVLLAFTLYFFVSLVTFNENDLVLSSTASEDLVIENYGGFGWGSSFKLLVFFIRSIILLISNFDGS